MNELYDGKVKVKFNAGNHRYSVSLDDGKTWDYKPGVTGILGRILAKEALMLWSMDEALKYLFGQTFEEELQDDGSIIVKPVYNESSALLRAEDSYLAIDYQRMLEHARSAHTKKRDKGGDVGHEVHSLIEYQLTLDLNPTVNMQFKITDVSKEANKAFTAWKEWYKDNDPKLVSVERVVYSKIFNYCGTLDAILNIDGKRVLVDWKTSNYSRTAPKGIYADNFIQLGGYAQAYDEEFKPGFQDESMFDDLLIVNASKQGKVNAVYASELGLTVNKAKLLFTRALDLHDGKRELEARLEEKK